MTRSVVWFCFLFSAAAWADPLAVYSSRKEQLIAPLVQQYEKKTGTPIEVRSGSAGNLIQMLKAEGKKTPADVLITVDAGNLWYAAEQGLLLPLQDKKLMGAIPSFLRDPKNRWFGLSLRARTIVYNKEKVKPSELSTYAALGDEKWENKLCLRTSKKVYNQSLVAMLIHEHGEQKAKQIVANWVKNTRQIFSSDTQVVKAVAEGQCHLGVVNSYYFGRLKKKDSDINADLYWPNQKGSYGVHVNVSGGGVIRHSGQKKEAKKFLAWLASKEAQKTFAQVNMEFAVHPDVAQDPIVQSWGNFKMNKDFNLSLAGKLQADAIQLMNEVGYR